MTEPHLVIIGGGLAGLSAGCYARASGLRTTIVEHNLALGGVCTSWPRGHYVVDGCIHWLTGGPFLRLYEELGIVPAVPLRTLEHWATYHDVESGLKLPVTRDLQALVAELGSISPEDSDELKRLVEAAEVVASLQPPIDRPSELSSAGERLGLLWEMREALGVLARFRHPVGEWGRDHLKSARLRRFFGRLVADEAPALLLLMVLGYLKRGYLSRPVGGTAAFRDALVDSYQRLGGEVLLHTTADEILVEHGRARGVRLADGTLVEGDAVISTSSMPETVLRLLGGRYGADETRRRMERWPMIPPIVLASFGVAKGLPDSPSMLLVDGVEPFDAGGRENRNLYLRICNDDPSFAPPGHSVVQAMVETDYGWWATRGSRYGQEKHVLLEALLDRIGRELPEVTGNVRMVDVATPLTYWTMARSWRGAYEGWMPSAESLFGHVKKTLPGLGHFCMAGQWVEPGGGVPSALMSGRQAAQLLCAELGRTFVASLTPQAGPAGRRPSGVTAPSGDGGRPVIEARSS